MSGYDCKMILAFKHKMKSIPQSLLVLAGCFAVALVILAVFSIYSVKVPPQRQAIHIFDNPNLKLSNPDGLIKISEISILSYNHNWTFSVMHDLKGNTTKE